MDASKRLKFKSKSGFIEFFGKKVIFLSALTALIAIVLIFAFIFKEALPVLTDPDVRDQAGLDNMLLKQSYQEGEPSRYSWRPTSRPPRFSIIPLILGTIKAALIAILFAAPLGIGAAVYSSEFAPRRAREIIKPMIEMLAAIPSVVLGFFALIVLATFIQDLLGLTFRLNALNAGIALGFAVIPIIYTVAEDAMAAVPLSLREAAVALGANPWQVSASLVIPAALPGIAAGVLLGFGRAVGETMIVLMASGNAAIMSASLTDSVRTLAATIAAEMGEVIYGGAHYSVLFFLGAVLFIFTFTINLGGELALSKIKERLQGKTK